MSIATGLALAAGVAAIGAGAKLAGSAIEAHAAGSAADKQAAAAQAALDFTKGQKAKQESAAAPYLAAGGRAVSMLPGAVRPATAGQPPNPYSVAPGTTPTGSQTGYSTLGAASSSPAYGLASPGSIAPSVGGQSAPGVSAPATSGMVLLQAPDGSQRSVPANLAPQYIARGAKQVSQ